MNWSCPPGVPTAEELLGDYRTVYLIGVKVCYDQEQRSAALASPKAADLVRSESYGVVKKALLEVLLNLEQMVPGSYTVAAGRCEQCEKCSRIIGRICGGRSGCAIPFPPLASTSPPWPGRSWVWSCYGPRRGCRSTTWRFPPF